MNEPSDHSPRHLALGLARWLEQERRRGIVYAPWELQALLADASPTPAEPSASVAMASVAMASGARASDPAATDRVTVIKPAALAVLPAAPEQSLQNVTAPETDRKQDLREQAQAWSPGQKLTYLRERVVGDCQRCPLSKTRRKLVFGVGSPQARVMFVGEAPGADEDMRGEPFVGAAGQRLNQWLTAVGLTRDEVYIANVLKCRPPQNRDPDASEIATCSPFLRAQIRAISPTVLVALGRFAGSLLLGKSGERMNRMRGSIHEYVDTKAEGPRIPVVVTFHPSYVLRAERDAPRAAASVTKTSSGREQDPQREAIADLQTALSLLRRIER